MDKLQRLINHCEGEVALVINEHKSNYLSVAEYLNRFLSEYIDDIPTSELRMMIITDTIVDLHYYPISPIGFHKILAHDVETALNLALKET